MRHNPPLEGKASRRVWSVFSMWILVVAGMTSGCASTGGPDLYVDDYAQLRPFVTPAVTETAEDGGSPRSTGPVGESPAEDEGKAGL